MSSRQPATVAFSLEAFARHGGPAGPLRDGWGIAYLQQRDAFLVKESAPAGSSELVRFIESQDVRSTLVLSHIRQATHGPVSFENTQPFVRELAGRAHVFAHNGDLPDVAHSRDLPLGRWRPMGDTDSERSFCALLHAVEPLWMDSPGIPALGDRLEIVSGFARAVRGLGLANFLYWDGDALFAHGHRRTPPGGGPHRPPGLHTLARHCAFEPDALRTPGVTVETPGTRGQDVLLVASVPLTDEGWQPLDEGEIVVASGGLLRAREKV
jgi:glutamine amidotransferase